VYTTVYTTIYRHIVTNLVSTYRVVSEIITELTVDYYDPETEELYTTISYPTNYLRTVYTVLDRVETHIYTEVTPEPPQPTQPTSAPPRGAPQTPTGTTKTGVILAV